MLIVQISDTHISRDHPSRTADLAACIRSINASDPRPDVVIHTGDIAHDGCSEEYDIARRLLETLSAPYFVLPGNRDKRRELTEVFADGRHIRHGMEFVQYSVEHFEARLLLIDTVSETSNKGRLCEARLAHIATMLAADTSRPTALFLHHPPFAVSVAPDPFQFEQWREVEALEERLRTHPQISGVFCGHVHRNVAAAVGPVQASTVSCVAIDLRKGCTGASNADHPIFETHRVGGRLGRRWQKDPP